MAKSPKPETGTLYVCATPIGNLEDASFRLIRTLQEVDLIACEDTRKTKILLDRYDLTTAMVSIEKFSEGKKVKSLIDRLQKGESLALVSDAGTPAISDPGAHFVRQVRDAGIPVYGIPGPSSVTTVLSISGILANQFFFGGFFPKSETHALALLKKTSGLQVPVVFFESAKRFQKTLSLLASQPESWQVFAAKELTKRFETTFEGRAKDVLKKWTLGSHKGEWCLILTCQAKTSDLDLAHVLSVFQKAGLSKSQMVKLGTTLFHFKRNTIYDAAQLG